MNYNDFGKFIIMRIINLFWYIFFRFVCKINKDSFFKYINYGFYFLSIKFFKYLVM